MFGKIYRIQLLFLSKEKKVVIQRETDKNNFLKNERALLA
jgi:hypothetical protein